ncbi:MAG: hypothetical protein V3V99_00330 [candidate division Zixibacteria bacterium]
MYQSNYRRKFETRFKGMAFASRQSNNYILQILNMAQKILILFILVLTASVMATESPHDKIEFVDGPYVLSDTIQAAPGHPIIPTEIENITDSLSDYVVGRMSVHQIGFILPENTKFPSGLIKKRKIVLTFPPEFDISTVTSVTYLDKDSTGYMPNITGIFVYSESVVIEITEYKNDPHRPYQVYFNIDAIANPIRSGDYRIVVQVDNFFGRTIAGPNFSDFFTILPDEPAQLAILPTGDLSIIAGETIMFEAFIADQYGNIISPETAIWSIDDTQDNIGRMFGSAFQATTVGVGRVVATAGDLTAYSGEITVSPGETAQIIAVHESESVNAGTPLNNDITITLADDFGNRKYDFIGSVWFESDDSEAEITYDVSNPYQFTAQDQGRRVFSGDGFIFKTAGQRVLLVKEVSGLSATIENIFVLSGQLADFDVSFSQNTRAGEPLTISISNAVDSSGNPFTGMIDIAGGEIAPDGTMPIINNIYVGNGEGSTNIRLFAAGINNLVLSHETIERTLDINILPAQTDRMSLSVDETQFIGNKLFGGLTIEVFDRYENLKTDYNEVGGEVRFESETGEFTPEAIQPATFINGVADITEISFDGQPGPTVLLAKMIVDGELLIESTEFIANGIVARPNDDFPIASTIPETWEASVRAYGKNFGNITPVFLEFRSEIFNETDEQVISPYPDQCLPEPGDAIGCVIIDNIKAEFPAEEYDYIIIAEAHYQIDDIIFITEYEFSHMFEVVPFIPFEVISENLPDTAFQYDYDLQGGIVIRNENSYEPARSFDITLRIAQDSSLFSIAQVRFKEFNWEPEISHEFMLRLRDEFPTNIYEYIIEYRSVIQFEDNSIVTYRGKFDLGKNLSILPRANILVNDNAITPASAIAGSAVSFTIPLKLIGSSSINLNGAGTQLIVTDGSITSSARLLEDEYILTPGVTNIASAPLTIPEEWIGKTLTAKLLLNGIEADIIPVDEVKSFAFPVTIVGSQFLSIGHLSIEAPNAPHVNTGQEFGISGYVINTSTEDFEESLTVGLFSDGESIVFEPVDITSVPAKDSVKVLFYVMAGGNPNPAERFYMVPLSGQDVLQPRPDNNIVAVIQTPAKLIFDAEFVDRPGSLAILDYAEDFSIVAEYRNNGQAEIEGGTLILDYFGSGDFGVNFPIELPLDDELIWNLTSPATELISEFLIKWGELPIDKNTGEAVEDLSQPIILPFMVKASITKLVIQPDSFDTQPLVRDATAILFKLMMENVSNDIRNSILINTITITVTDRDGKQIDGEYLVTETGSAFYLDDQPITSLELVDGKLAYSFTGLIIPPGEKEIIELRFTPKVDAFFDFFNMRLESADISAEFASGPRIGEKVTVTGILDRAFEINLPQAIIATEFGESFKNYPNPFNPNFEETEFIYNLPTDSDVDIYIYAVTGERVRHLHYDAGSVGGQSDQLARAYWDGHNGEGDVVLNGVYVAYIEVAEGNLTAKVKIAVVK